MAESHHADTENQALSSGKAVLLALICWAIFPVPGEQFLSCALYVLGNHTTQLHAQLNSRKIWVTGG